MRILFDKTINLCEGDAGMPVKMTPRTSGLEMRDMFGQSTMRKGDYLIFSTTRTPHGAVGQSKEVTAPIKGDERVSKERRYFVVLDADANDKALITNIEALALPIAPE